MPVSQPCVPFLRVDIVLSMTSWPFLLETILTCTKSVNLPKSDLGIYLTECSFFSLLCMYLNEASQTFVMFSPRLTSYHCHCNIFCSSEAVKFSWNETMALRRTVLVLKQGYKYIAVPFQERQIVSWICDWNLEKCIG